jgi:transcriptional regulator GlxA family with amidase domain
VKIQRFGFLLLRGFSLQALAGALEALSAVNKLLEGEAYECLLLGIEDHVSASGGVRLQCHPLTAPLVALDAVWVISDGPFHEQDPLTPVLLPWLRACAAQASVMGGIGTGAAWLAEAGLLDQYRSTLDWPHAALLSERHPEVLVTQHLYEIDRDRISCAGQLCSQDMMIAWLAQQHGERLAQELTSSMGLERLRGRQEYQHQPVISRLGGGSAKLAEAVALMEANLGEPLTTEDIAGLVGVSRRQLERLFKQHLDAMPARWYLDLRLERARRMLRQTGQSVLQIGLSCGFASASHFSNAYKSCFGVTPREERSRHSAAWRSGAEMTGRPKETP